MGYWYRKDGDNGIMEYRFVPPIDTSRDELAFGFMTWHPNGTLVRIDSGISADYIDARLVSDRNLYSIAFQHFTEKKQNFYSRIVI